MKRMLLVICVGLSGCAAKHSVWQRFDGQSIQNSPAFQQQFAVDTATCRAVAVNAGSAVQQPNTVTVYTSPEPSGGGFAGGLASGLAAGAPAMAAAARRNQVENVNLEACMAQHGYRMVGIERH